MPLKDVEIFKPENGVLEKQLFNNYQIESIYNTN